MGKNLIFVVVLLAIVGVGIFWYVGLESPEIKDGVITSPTQYGITRDNILREIDRLKNIKLDTSILDDPAFVRLERAPSFVPQVLEVRRPNPFVPYGVE